MYGVVLWSDSADCKAVIWCEDHGDLAFYRAGGDYIMDGPSLDVGDLVHFDLSTQDSVRYANEPKLIAEQQFPLIAERLKVKRGELFRSLGGEAAEDKQSENAADNGNVVSLFPRGASARVA